MIAAHAKRLPLFFAASLCALAAFGAPGAAAEYTADCPTPNPEFGVCHFDAALTEEEAGEHAFLQAAGHPYDFTTTLEFDFYDDSSFGPSWPSEPLKSVVIEEPAGFAVNPMTADRCTLTQLVGLAENPVPSCPPASQVGVANVIYQFCLQGTFFCPETRTEAVPLYNLFPTTETPARFGFQIFGVVTTFDGGVGAAPSYRATVHLHNASEGLAVLGSEVTLWGVPADPIHTPQRPCPSDGGPECPAEHPLQAFLRLPTSCQGPQATDAHVDSWFNPATFNSDGSPNLSDPNWKSAGFLTHQLSGDSEPGAPIGNSGCEEVPFEPTISVQPTTNQADSPSGLEVDLSVPQDELTDPAAIAQSDLRRAVLALPQGMTVNPASAAGQGACTPAQIDLATTLSANCPDSSKIGTLSIETPLLDHPIPGEVYLASQKDNPFGSLLAIYFVADDPQTGVVLKLAGKVEPRADGQLITTFDDQPQLPFSRLHVELFGGPRASLRTPPTCGTHTATATMTPWSGNAPVPLASSFQITAGPGGSPCPSGQFDPHLSGGSENLLGGAFTPFHLRLSRDDGTRELTGLSATLPPGLAARFAGIPYCPESALAGVSEAEGTAAAQIASPSCPAASLLGTVSAGAGAGPNPFYLSTGRAYLAGPYKGAPLSIAVITPALAGPFDLGSVLVRSALFVDPTTAQGRAVSDPLPIALHGIGLDLRDLRVDLDRPRFTLNPTSCDPSSIEADISGTGGASAHRSQRFQVANCADLAFKPHLKLRLKGGTKRADHPSFISILRAHPGNANIARAQVILPNTVQLDQAHIRTVCTRVRFAAESCPKGSIYGHAKAITPLLDEPLEGPVYLRSSDHLLPDVVADLHGQVHIVLDGRVDSIHKRLRTTFEKVPDTPVSRFVLSMQGGGKGLLVNNTNLCRHDNAATVLLDGQNGKTADQTPRVSVRCRGARKRHRGQRG